MFLLLYFALLLPGGRIDPAVAFSVWSVHALVQWIPRRDISYTGAHELPRAASGDHPLLHLDTPVVTTKPVLLTGSAEVADPLSALSASAGAGAGASTVAEIDPLSAMLLAEARTPGQVPLMALALTRSFFVMAAHRAPWKASLA